MIVSITTKVISLNCCWSIPLNLFKASSGKTAVLARDLSGITTSPA
jgi:hypothetical protein